MKLAFPFGSIIAKVNDKPEQMTAYAAQRMALVRETLRDMPPYACPPSCNLCCHGTILMSYVEYVHILHVMFSRLAKEELSAFFAERLGTLEEENKLLCPFVHDEKESRHCSIYADRPLVCRVFGTSASPCAEEIAFPPFPEPLFYRAYDLLYDAEDGGFIGLPLVEDLALYEAPFDLWAIADSGHTAELLALFARHGSMRAVLCDMSGNQPLFGGSGKFFVLESGGRRYLGA